MNRSALGKEQLSEHQKNTDKTNTVGTGNDKETLSRWNFLSYFKQGHFIVSESGLFYMKEIGF